MAQHSDPPLHFPTVDLQQAGLGRRTASLPSCWEGSSTCPAVGSHQILPGLRSISGNEAEGILGNVTEPKPALLATGQANKSGDELLGQGITTLIGKLADREDGRLVSRKTVFQIRAPFKQRKGKGRGPL